MNGFKKAIAFYREVVEEMKKVSFPSLDEVRKTTVVVLITSVIFAAYLWVADQAILRIYEQIHRWLGA